MRRKLALGYIPDLVWWPGKGTGTSGKHPPNAAKGSYCFCEEEGDREGRVRGILLIFIKITNARPL